MALANQIGRPRPGFPADANDMQADLSSLFTRVNAITTEQIVDGNVTQGKIAAGAVSTGQIASGALTADSTGWGKMADAFVITAKLADSSITNIKVADAVLTFAKVASGSQFARAKFGTYTGSGANPNAITGVGFQPNMVFAIASGTGLVWVAMDGLASGSPLVGPLVVFGGSLLATSIQYDTDGFTLTTTNSGPNNSGRTYAYFAIRSA